MASMRSALFWVGWVLFAAVVLAACGGEEETETGATADTRLAGEQLYAMHCAACHGEEGVGTAQGPPLVHIVYEPSHHSDESFHRAVRDGVVPHHWEFGPMPPVHGVTDEQVDQIVAYVRHLQREAGIE